MSLPVFKSTLIYQCLLSLLIGLLFPTALYSQSSNSAKELVLRLDSLSGQQPRELIYLQVNKDVYASGEDLWFKAYVLNSQRLVPSVLSQTFYLTALNEKTGKAFWQEKYLIENGFSGGHVYLPDTLSEGNYVLEAFTSNSFFGGDSGLKSVRKIVVKKEIKPHPSFRAEFDKLFYKPGDTVKVTITARSSYNQPLYSDISADLLRGSKVLSHSQTATYPEGKGSLSFVLNDHSEGLRISCLAKYGGNGEKEEALSYDVPCKRGSSIQFNTFPEGGNMVAGLSGKLAFKAVNMEGKPEDVKGIVFENDKPLLNFSSVHAGIGSFTLTPKAGSKFHIRLSQPATDSIFELPPVLSEGISLQLTGRDSGFLEFTVSQGPEYTGEMIYLRGQIRGKVCCLAQATLDESLQIKVPLAQFSQQGIAEFTLFDSRFRPVAERLVYLHPDQKLNIVATLDKASYETRGKAILKIKVSDSSGNPVAANLGVAVFDKLCQTDQSTENILTHCYLTEQLNGRIYAPEYYFDEKNADREQALDLLLLTQGWRRYVWNEANLEANPNSASPLITDGTKGVVRYTRNLKQAPKGSHVVMAFNPAVNKQTKLLMADSAGRFVVTPECLKLWPGEYAYLKPMGNADFKPLITIDEPFDRITEAMRTKEVIYPLAGEPKVAPGIQEISDLTGLIQLKEFTVKGSEVTRFRDKYMGHLDSLAKLDMTTDYVGPCGILNCPIHLGDKKNTKPIEGVTYIVYQGFRWLEDIPGVGRRYTAIGQTMETYHYPRFSAKMLLEKYNLCSVKAYYAKREFYQPNYDQETGTDLIPDSRNALLWEPYVVTDEKGEASVTFFCSDINADFVGDVEGVGSKGLLGRTGFGFKVIKRKK